MKYVSVFFLLILMCTFASQTLYPKGNMISAVYIEEESKHTINGTETITVKRNYYSAQWAWTEKNAKIFVFSADVF